MSNNTALVPLVFPTLTFVEPARAYDILKEWLQVHVTPLKLNGCVYYLNLIESTAVQNAKGQGQLMRVIIAAPHGFVDSVSDNRVHIQDASTNSIAFAFYECIRLQCVSIVFSYKDFDLANNKELANIVKVLCGIVDIIVANVPVILDKNNSLLTYTLDSAVSVPESVQLCLKTDERAYKKDVDIPGPKAVRWFVHCIKTHFLDNDMFFEQKTDAFVSNLFFGVEVFLQDTLPIFAAQSKCALVQWAYAEALKHGFFLGCIEELKSKSSCIVHLNTGWTLLPYQTHKAAEAAEAAEQAQGSAGLIFPLCKQLYRSNCVSRQACTLYSGISQNKRFTQFFVVKKSSDFHFWRTDDMDMRLQPVVAHAVFRKHKFTFATHVPLNSVDGDSYTTVRNLFTRDYSKMSITFSFMFADGDTMHVWYNVFPSLHDEANAAPSATCIAMWNANFVMAVTENVLSNYKIFLLADEADFQSRESTPLTEACKMMESAQTPFDCMTDEWRADTFPSAIKPY